MCPRPLWPYRWNKVIKKFQYLKLLKLVRPHLSLKSLIFRKKTPVMRRVFQGLQNKPMSQKVKLWTNKCVHCRPRTWPSFQRHSQSSEMRGEFLEGKLSPHWRGESHRVGYHSPPSWGEGHRVGYHPLQWVGSHRVGYLFLPQFPKPITQNPKTPYRKGWRKMLLLRVL
jgi:hypothetical protein